VSEKQQFILELLPYVALFTAIGVIAVVGTLPAVLTGVDDEGAGAAWFNSTRG